MAEKIIEAWSGPGRKDGVITEFKPEHDALHIDMKRKGNCEWWFFDTRLENGFVVIGFFRAKHERTGKTGVEITIYKPNGEKIQRIFNYSQSDLVASSKDANVRIGNNYIKVDYLNEKLPTYEVFIDEGDIGFHLVYKAKIPGWMPGKGYTQFGDLGHFGWSIALPKAEVEGTIKVDNEEIKVKGLGYHDHNWLNLNFATIIDHWYWGRLYSDNYTLIFAYIKCNKRMDNYPIKVLMLAKGEEIILSTGEYEFAQEELHYNEKADSNYPKYLNFNIPEKLKASLEVQEIIDADNLLFELGPILRFVVRYILRLKPGYFRFNSKFKLEIRESETWQKEQGDMLYEMVMTK